jgi:hypothetical protein
VESVAFAAVPAGIACFCEVVPEYASARTVRVPSAATAVLAGRHHVEVVGVPARPIQAQVIYRQPGRDRATKKLVSQPMHAQAPDVSAELDFPIPVGANVSLPSPARRPEAAVLLNDMRVQ